MPDQEFRGISHKFFSASLVALFGALIAFIVFLSMMINGQERRIELLMKNHKVSTKEAVDASLSVMEERVMRRIDGLESTRNLAISSMHDRIKNQRAHTDKQVQALQAGQSMLVADLTALSRFALTEDMWRRIMTDIAESAGRQRSPRKIKTSPSSP